MIIYEFRFKLDVPIEEIYKSGIPLLRDTYRVIARDEDEKRLGFLRNSTYQQYKDKTEIVELYNDEKDE